MTSSTGSEPRRRGRPGGFSLLELLLIMLILTVVVGISAPRFTGAYRRVQLERVASDVAAVFAYARAQAVAREELLRVHFDVEGRRFWLTRAAGTSPEGPFERVSGRFGQTATLPAMMSWTASARDVTLYPDGRADPFEVVLTDPSGERYRLVTEVWTGRIRLVEGHER